MAQASKSEGLRRVIPIEGTGKAVGVKITKSVDELMKSLEARFGKGAVARVDKQVKRDIPVIPTGIPQIDLQVIGAGGIPQGMIIEIYGPEAGGKTTICLQIIGQAQKTDPRMTGFVDAEHRLYPKRAQTLGVDLKRMLVSQPDCGEQALEIVEAMVETGAFSVIVIDSVAALVPRAELDGEMGDSSMGLQARLLSQAMRKLIGKSAQANTTLIFINQVREKIGVMFGNPETTTGGRALKFYATVRLDVRRIGAIKDGEEIVGNKTRVKGAKNSVGSPFQEAEVDLLYSIGFDTVGSWLDMAVEHGVIMKSGGAWLVFQGERIANGRANAIAALKENAELLAAIQEATRSAFNAANSGSETKASVEEPVEENPELEP